uniref:Odorant receptor n=1 Tax=Cacopsylla melanoneura TaxID=428564 RepID=A0A8D8ZFM2_9HEMI
MMIDVATMSLTKGPLVVRLRTFAICGAVYAASVKFIRESERMNECQEMVERAIYQSAWYRLSSDARKMVNVMLRRSQRSNHITCLNNMMIIDYKLLTATNNFFYTLLNFMNNVRGRM